MIKISNLEKSFGTLNILKGIDLEIKDGERICIIGPSGCGKSTLLRCINGLEKPTKGTIKFKNKNINSKSTNIYEVRKHIGMIFQQFNLFPHLSILKNITLAPTKLGIMNEKTAKEKALKLLEEVDLSDKAYTYPSKLSGGQMQRVAIARALIMNPEMLLCDEPTSALDPEMVGEVIQILKKIGKKGMTMVVVTHEMKFIEEFATRVIFMDEGKIIEEGPSKEILYNPKSDRLKEFLEKVKK